MVISEIRANSKIRAPSERGCPDRGGSTVVPKLLRGKKKAKRKENGPSGKKGLRENKRAKRVKGKQKGIRGNIWA